MKLLKTLNKLFKNINTKQVLLLLACVFTIVFVLYYKKNIDTFYTKKGFIQCGTDKVDTCQDCKDKIKCNNSGLCGWRPSRTGGGNCYVKQRDFQRLYKGTISETKTGKKCQAWNTDKPNVRDRWIKNTLWKDITFKRKKGPTDISGVGNHNYCRNAQRYGFRRFYIPWCYTADEEGWDYCNVINPQPTKTNPSRRQTTQSSRRQTTQSPQQQTTQSPQQQTTQSSQQQSMIKLNKGIQEGKEQIQSELDVAIKSGQLSVNVPDKLIL